MDYVFSNYFTPPRYGNSLKKVRIGYEFAFRNQTPASVTFLVKRVNHFRLSALTIFTTDSHMFTIPTI
jgi:hypothetical protein